MEDEGDEGDLAARVEEGDGLHFEGFLVAVGEGEDAAIDGGRLAGLKDDADGAGAAFGHRGLDAGLGAGEEGCGTSCRARLPP